MTAGAEKKTNDIHPQTHRITILVNLTHRYGTVNCESLIKNSGKQVFPTKMNLFIHDDT